MAADRGLKLSYMKEDVSIKTCAVVTGAHSINYICRMCDYVNIKAALFFSSSCWIDLELLYNISRILAWIVYLCPS